MVASDVENAVGQVMMIGFRGTTIDEDIIEMISRYRVANVILNQANVMDAEQIRKVTSDLQQVAKDAGHQKPLLIATDQEGGMLASIRIDGGITQFPGAMALASSKCPERLVYDVAKATGIELLALGINWILGPVLDILNNPSNPLLGVRTFGRSTEDVSKFGAASARGLHDAGIITCGKHFPGYGNAHVSSLSGIPVINETAEHISAGFGPYRACIAEGTLDTILVGGAVLPNVSGQFSACLSRKVIQDFAKMDLGFQGLIMSECLQMESIYNDMGIPQAAIMAIFAGCDIILNCHNRAWQIEVIDTLNEAIGKQILPLEILMKAADRVTNLKTKYLLLPQLTEPDLKLHKELAEQAYEDCVQIVRDQQKMLPLTKLIQSRPLLLLTPLVYDFHASQRQAHSESQDTTELAGEVSFQDFGRRLSLHGKVIHTSYTANGLSSEIENLVKAAGAVLVLSADGVRNLYQISFTKYLSMICKYDSIPFCVMAVSNPFDFWDEPAVTTYIVTHEMTEHALRQAISVLMTNSELKQNDNSLTVTQPGTKQKKMINRSRWLATAYSTSDRGADKLYSQFRQILNLGVTSRMSFTQLTLDPKFTITVVKNPNTNEIYGLSVLGQSYLEVLYVVDSHRLMSIGYSLLRQALEQAYRQKYSTLNLRIDRGQADFFEHVGLTLIPSSEKSYSIDLHELQLEISPL